MNRSPGSLQTAMIQIKAQKRSPDSSRRDVTDVPSSSELWTNRRTFVVVALLLVVHYGLAVSSLLQENPTVDEVVHMPAGLSYWQKGTFRLYHHNPPLIKLIAALPVALAKPNVTELYQRTSWLSDPPDQASFAHAFAYYNVDRYFELFTSARLLMPLFGVLGGVFVFAWSRALFGNSGGLLSLFLWCVCPNVLAHDRLITTDVGASAIGFAATFLFWRFLKTPNWPRACLVGLVLGLAQLSKFSMLSLYVLWPVLWLCHSLLVPPATSKLRHLAKSIGQGSLIVLLSVLTIDIGYGFERVGIPLGKYEFACASLTRPIAPGRIRPRSKNPLLDGAWRFRENRFRRGWLENAPVPLPEHFVLGFDEQKLEAEGVPAAFLPGGPAQTKDDSDDELLSYPSYLNGVLRQRGWRYYYLYALRYKIPEGTWLLGLASLVVLGCSLRRCGKEQLADEAILFIVPAGTFLLMSFGTNINIGLRYILPIFPYAFTSVGRLAPWCRNLGGVAKRAAGAFTVLAMLLTAIATLTIHPHYLAYFNWVSGGPDRGSEHLIDSNLDWGQDLVGLARWARVHAKGERIGLAYFGQITPNILKARGEAFEWFVPPSLPGKMVAASSEFAGIKRPRALAPGLYAVSASIYRGLSWSLYDPDPRAIYPAWRANKDAFSYFRNLKPIDNIGHSILIFRVSKHDAQRLAYLWN